MRQNSNRKAVWLLCLYLITAVILDSVHSQETTGGRFDISNSSEPNVFGILNDLDMQNVIRNMQQDGRLDDIVNTIIAGATVSLNIHDECAKDIITMVQGIGNFDMWAIQMLDAIGKPHSGILADVDLKWYGSFDGCLDVKAITYTNKSLQTDPEHHFNGKYCTVGIPVPDFLRAANPVVPAYGTKITVGVCIPDSCNTADMKTVMTLVAKYVFNASSDYEPIASCHDGIEMETKTIVAIVIISIIGVVVVIGTLYDIFLRLALTANSEEPIRESIKDTNGILNGKVDADTGIKNERKIGVEMDEDKIKNGELMVQEQKSSVVQSTKLTHKRSTAEKVILSFSVYSNGLKILNTNQPKGALTCVNGIRFLSMTWVILGHSLDFDAQNSIPYFFKKKVWQWTFCGILSATVSVDTFFTLSGLLVSYLTLREMSKLGGAKKINWFMFYFHRYWRLTPAYMLTLMVYATIIRHIGDGPKWPQEDYAGNFCERNWWTNLIYVNNYVNPKEMCFGWSWYLANDMQFYVLSPLIIVPLFYNVKIGGLVAGLFMIGTTVARAIISKQHEYTALVGGFIGPKAKDPDFEVNMYMPAHTRMGPYIAGLITGYLLYRYKDNFKMKRVWNLLGWFICLSTIVLIIYGIYPDDGKHFLSVNESVAYVTLHRTAWGIAVSWIIFACATGHGGWINDFLSWSPFAPLGRLSYCTYLVHVICLQYYTISSRTGPYITDLQLIYFYIGNVVISYFVAFGTSLLFEAPMMGLEKVFFKRG